jgi:hypothetical protein
MLLSVNAEFVDIRGESRLLLPDLPNLTVLFSDRKILRNQADPAAQEIQHFALALRS